VTQATPERTPVTDRGRRTRTTVMDGAREAFEEHGYAATRMSDIASAANVSHGTVYTYFDTKESVLEAVTADVVTDLHRSLWTSTAAHPLDRIGDANERYLSAYRQHARLLSVVEEAAGADERFRTVLTEVRRTHVRRVAEAIRRLQREGLAASDLDPDTAAAALCAMVEGFARYWYGQGEPHDQAIATKTLTDLWAGGLGLPTPADDHTRANSNQEPEPDARRTGRSRRNTHAVH